MARSLSPAALAALAALFWQLADPLAILCFSLLVALGRLSPDVGVSAVLAVLAGRLTPRGPTLPPGGAAPASTSTTGPSSRRGPPSGVLSAFLGLRDLALRLVESFRHEPGPPLSHRPAHQ
jgi:hypothetical protein